MTDTPHLNPNTHSVSPSLSPPRLVPGETFSMYVSPRVAHLGHIGTALKIAFDFCKIGPPLIFSVVAPNPALLLLLLHSHCS